MSGHPTDAQWQAMVDDVFKSFLLNNKAHDEGTTETTDAEWDALVESCEKHDNERGLLWKAPIGSIMIGRARSPEDK